MPPHDDSPLLFPGTRGGYLDIHHFRPFQWRPAQLAVGITPLRRIYDLRHTFATFALRAGISTFDLSRYMGASLTMIDRHYVHGRLAAFSLTPLAASLGVRERNFRPGEAAPRPRDAPRSRFCRCLSRPEREALGAA